MTDAIEITDADRRRVASYMIDRARLAFNGTTAARTDLLMETLARHRLAERARICAWLRDHPGDHGRVFADAIEGGK